jgi:ribonuclease HI
MFVDGACSGNPGPGGWGAVLVCGEHRKEFSGSLDHTTSNRAELAAVLGGLHAIKKPVRVDIYTDSANVVGWLSLGWKRNDPEIRQYCAEIELVIASKGLTVTYHKVKGHNGHPLNERADQLAVAAIRCGPFGDEHKIPTGLWAGGGPEG